MFSQFAAFTTTGPDTMAEALSPLMRSVPASMPPFPLPPGAGDTNRFFFAIGVATFICGNVLTGLYKMANGVGKLE